VSALNWDRTFRPSHGSSSHRPIRLAQVDNAISRARRWDAHVVGLPVVAKIPTRQVFVGCLVDADRRSAHRTGLLKATPTLVRNGWASGWPIDYAARGDQRRDVVVTVLDWQYTYVRFSQAWPANQ
jgi:hypothetical protein